MADEPKFPPADDTSITGPVAPAVNWFLQRVTGLFLAAFLLTHVIVLHFIRNGTIDFSNVAERVHNNPFWFTFYLSFIVMGVFHALNGLWSIINDYSINRTLRLFILGFFWVFGIAACVFGMFVLNGLVNKM